MGLLDFIVGSADPSTVDPQTGLNEQQRRQSAYGGLTQIGASLLAAGQPMDPSQRAPYLAQLGQVPQQMQAQQSGMAELQTRYAQQKLMQQKLLEQKTEADMIRSPEFQAALAKLPPEMQALAKVSPAAAIAAVRDNTTMQRAEVSAAAADKRLGIREDRSADRQAALFRQQQALQDAREAARQRLEDGKDKAIGPDVVKIGGRLYKQNIWSGKLEPIDLPGVGGGAPAPQEQAPGMPPSAMPQLGIPQAALSIPQQQLTAPPSPAAAAPPSTVVPPNAGGQGGGEMTPGPVKQTLNTEMLGQLDPAEARIIHAIATYQQAPPAGAGQRGLMAKQRMMSKVQEYTNGSYKEGLYKRIQDAEKEMGPNGVTGRGLIANDTAYAHLGTMYDAFAAMHNKNEPALNAVVNKVKEQLGRPEITNFNQVKVAVGTEIAKALHGAGAVPLEQVKEWQALFASASSPPQMQAAITQAMTLLEGREKSALGSFRRTTEHDYGRSLISDENLAKRDFIRNNPLDAKKSKGAPAAVTGGAPVPNVGPKPTRRYNMEKQQFEEVTP